MTTTVLPAATTTGDRQLCTFRVGNMLLGLDVLAIQEVLYLNEITDVPHAPPAVMGLINLRGQIATALDLHLCLDLPVDERGPGVHVVVRYRGEPISLRVDEIGDVMTLDDGLFEPPPETVSGVTRELITGAYKLRHELLLTLDLDRTIALTRSQP